MAAAVLAAPAMPRLATSGAFSSMAASGSPLAASGTMTPVGPWPNASGSATLTERRAPVRQGGVSMSQRCADLQANMLGNLSSLAAHRGYLEEVERGRRERAEQACREFTAERANNAAAAASRPSSASCGFRTLKERCRALQEDSQFNQGLIEDRRSVIDNALTKRREYEQACQEARNAANACEANQAAQAEPGQTSARSSAWAPSPTGGGDAARCTMFMRDARDAYEVRAAAFTNRYSRPVSAPNFGCRRVFGTSSGAGTGTRPVSASAVSGTATQRPVSAVSAPGARPRPRSGRPTSAAGTLKGRCRALESELQKNKAELESNREVLDWALKVRREANERAAALTAS
eukprot:TRINITY_DN3759_c0_g1_i1.p1 TRINITY_DN3759_c0_g1~~TRINITY_DN3759_c0_g1_i1.p1  ORF type:complete len:349 (-),score=57.66 TRINITY_DN3759_c0_g1_i1:226-1272(-)